MFMRLPVLTVAALAAASSFTIANAADPSSGTISTSAPKVEWGGTVASSGVTNNAWAQDPTFECQAPACDHFALKVATPGNVTLTLTGFVENTAGGDPGCGIRVIHPDGKAEYFSGTCGPKTIMKVVLKNAPAGDYSVDVADSHVASPTSGTEDYKASATLGATAAPAPPPTPGPVATPAPPGPGPSTAPAVTLTVKAPALSSKKLAKAKKFSATLKSSGPLSKVNALLVNSKKKLGSGSLPSLDGAGKIVVKVKAKLKPGTYQLSVGGRDAQGRNVVATAKVKVKK